jgi:hypothetical protein
MSESDSQLFSPADLRAGVELQTDEKAKISVKGLYGKPLPGGPNVHILAAVVRSIGDVIAPNHPVIVYGSDGAKVGAGTTDENGVLHMKVPKDDKYRIELVEQEEDDSGEIIEVPHVVPQDPVFHRVVAKFLDGKGKPLAGVAVSIDGADSGIVTDAAGLFDIPGHMQAYELTVRGQKFVVHGLPSDDHDKSEENTSVFYLSATETA